MFTLGHQSHNLLLVVVINECLHRLNRGKHRLPAKYCWQRARQPTHDAPEWQQPRAACYGDDLFHQCKVLLLSLQMQRCKCPDARIP